MLIFVRMNVGERIDNVKAEIEVRIEALVEVFRNEDADGSL